MGRRRKHNKNLPNRVYLSHGQYFFVDAKGKWHPLGRSMGEMYRSMARFHDDQSTIISMDDLFTRYELLELPKKAEKTQTEYSRALKLLKAVFGKMAPKNVRPRDIYAYRDKRGRTTESCANNELGVLSHVFTKGVEWGAVESNPCRDVRKFSTPPRDRYVTDAEYQAVYELTKPMIQVAMDLALLTGLRRGDLLRLSRDHLVDDGILIKTSKTGQPLLIEWSDELFNVIDRAKRIKPQVRRTIICNRQGKPYTGNGFSARWQRLMRKAVEKKVIQERFRFHDLRAKSASDDTLEAATQRLGHMDAKFTERVYRRKPRRVKPLR